MGGPLCWARSFAIYEDAWGAEGGDRDVAAFVRVRATFGGVGGDANMFSASATAVTRCLFKERPLDTFRDAHM